MVLTELIGKTVKTARCTVLRFAPIVALPTSIFLVDLRENSLELRAFQYELS